MSNYINIPILLEMPVTLIILQHLSNKSMDFYFLELTSISCNKSISPSLALVERVLLASLLHAPPLSVSSSPPSTAAALPSSLLVSFEVLLFLTLIFPGCTSPALQVSSSFCLKVILDQPAQKQMKVRKRE